MIQESIDKKKIGDKKYNHKNKKWNRIKSTLNTINEKNKIACSDDSLRMVIEKASKNMED